jgi:hypothetical protein
VKCISILICTHIDRVTRFTFARRCLVSRSEPQHHKDEQCYEQRATQCATDDCADRLTVPKFIKVAASLLLSRGVGRSIVDIDMLLTVVAVSSCVVNVDGDGNVNVFGNEIASVVVVVDSSRVVVGSGVDANVVLVLVIAIVACTLLHRMCNWPPPPNHTGDSLNRPRFELCCVNMNA